MNTEKKFFEKNSAGQPFYSFSHGQKFSKLSLDMIDKGINTYKDFSTSFFSSNIPWRKEVFGKQVFCTSDSANRRLYVWRVDLNNGVLWIITGDNGRGTSYEWYSENNHYDELYDEIIEYLLKVYNLDGE